MSTRLAVFGAFMLAATSTAAEELGPREAWAFIVEKPFTLTCSDGTVGAGRILPDGSVVGQIRVGAVGEMQSGTLPAGTVRVSDAGMCAYFPGLPVQPCLKVKKIDRRRFHASFSLLGACEIDSLIPPSLRRARTR